MVDERRQHPRIDTRIDVSARVIFPRDGDAPVLTGLMRNYSASGARLALTAPRGLVERLQTGGDGGVVICDVDGAPLRLCGEVRWARASGGRRELELGLRFIGVGRADLEMLDKLTRGQPLTAPAKRRPLLWLAGIGLGLFAGWQYLDRTSKAEEVTRLKADLAEAEERRDSLSRRLRAAEDRARALETRGQQAPIPSETPAAPPPPVQLPTPHVNPQPPPPSTHNNDDEPMPPPEDHRNSL